MFRKSLPYVLGALGLLFAVAADGQTVQPPYSSSYTLVSLGPVPGLDYGALTFLDTSTLLYTSCNEGCGNSVIYSVPVTRGSNGHVTGFGTSAVYAMDTNQDAGLAFGPGGVLFARSYTN